MFFNYALPVLTALLGTVHLFKDWDNHKTHLRRAAVIVFIILIGLGGVASTYYSDRRNSAKRAEDQAQIKALSAAVETANKAQADNTKLFTNKLGDFSQKIANLQTAIKTDDLRKEAQKLQSELRSTQAALVRPQAKLAFTFWADNADLLNNPTQQASLPVHDGVVAISFSVVNPTDTTAEDGEVLFFLGQRLSFAEEPQGFVKFPGASDTQRNIVFGRVLARSFLPKYDVKIKVPDDVGNLQVGMKYKCKNCFTRNEMQIATVNLIR